MSVHGGVPGSRGCLVPEGCLLPVEGGCLFPGGLALGVPGGDPPEAGTPQTATAAGSTHPTGMHSCLYMCPQTPKIAHREGRGSAAFGQHLSHPYFDSKLCNG